MNEKIEAWLRARDAERFQRDMDKSAASVRRVGAAGDTAGKGLGRMSSAGSHALGVLGGLVYHSRYVALAFGGATAAAGYFGLKFDSVMEQNQVAFTHFLGSTTAAQDELTKLYHIAATTPFSFANVTQATKQLLAYGMSLKDANAWLGTISDTISGVGGGQEEINRMVMAIGQIGAKPLLQAQDLRQLNELGLKTAPALMKAFHLTAEQVGDIGKQGISSAKALPILKKAFDKQFGGMSAAQAKTFQGQLSTMKDYAAQAAGALTQPLYDLLKGNVFPKINKKLQGISAWARGGGVGRAGSALSAGFSDGVGPATAGYTGLNHTMVQVGATAGTIWNIMKKGVKLVKPVIADLLGILQHLWKDVLVPLAPFVGGALYAAFQTLAGVLHFVNHNFGLVLAVVAPLAAAFATYRGLVIALTVAEKVLSAISLASTFLEAAAAGGVMTAAMTALDVALDANPVVIIIAAIAGLVAGLIIAYNKVGWFHRAVDVAFHAIQSVVSSVVNFIKKHWQTILSVMIGPVATAAVFIGHHWSEIKSGASSVVSWIRGAFNKLIGFFTGLPSRIGHVAAGMFDGIKNAFRDAINWIIRGWNNLHFHIGGQSLGPLGHLPAINIGTPNIPELATGGVITASGFSYVGARDDELAYLKAGSIVSPLRGARVKKGQGTVKAIDPEIHVHVHGGTTVLKVSGRELARVVAQDTEDRVARR